MASRRVREKIGRFVVTRESDLDSRGVACAECGRLLAENAETDSGLRPSPEELVAAGAIAIANFGWLCNQECGHSYERATGIVFGRDSNGLIKSN